MASIIDTKASLYSDLRSRSLLDFVGSNDGSFIGAPEWAGNGLRLLGSADAIDFGSTGLTVKTVAILLDPKSTSEDIADLDGGTHTIEVGSGTITATGFATPKIYVDNNLSSTLVANKRQLITITTATGFTASAFKVGKETTFLNGTVVAVFTSADELTASEVAVLNGELANTTWPTKPTTHSNANLKANGGQADVEGAWNFKPVDGELIDQSPNGRDVTLSGVMHARSLLGDTLEFFGTASLGTITGLNLTDFNDADWTVSVWCKPKGVITTQGIFGRAAGLPRLYVTAQAVSYDDLNIATFNTAAINVDNWNHYVATYDGTNVKTYLNGVLEDTTAHVVESGFISGSVFWGTAGGDRLTGQLAKGQFFFEAMDQAWVTKEFNEGKKALWKSDWGVNESVANVTSGFLENSPFTVNAGTFEITMDTINGQDVKVIDCISSGGLDMPTSFFQQTPTEAAFGKWEWYQKKVETGEIVVGIGPGATPIIAGNYRVQSGTTEVFSLIESAVAVLITAPTAITVDVWEKITLTRTNAGVFELFLNDVSQGTGTDLTIIEATLFSVLMKTGDKIAYSGKNGKFSINKHITI